MLDPPRADRQPVVGVDRGSNPLIATGPDAVQESHFGAQFPVFFGATAFADLTSVGEPEASGGELSWRRVDLRWLRRLQMQRAWSFRSGFGTGAEKDAPDSIFFRPVGLGGGSYELWRPRASSSAKHRWERRQ